MTTTKELIEDYNEYVKKIHTGCEKIVMNFSEEKIHEALRMVLDFSEGMLWLETVSSYLKNQDITASLDIEKIKEYLLEINEGLENQDFLLVSDIFEYEIMPFFEKDYAIVG